MSDTEKVITEEELLAAPLVAIPENNESELKSYLINFTGHKIQPEDGKVTAQMIIETVAAEFPEVVYLIAEETFARGYQLGLEDATTLTTEAETVTGNEE